MPANRLTFTLATAVILAACGGTTTASQPAAPASSSQSPAAPVSSAATSAQSSGSPAGSASAAGAAGPIRVGVLEPLTGSLAPVGHDNENGFNLYLSTIHNTVAGRKIEVTYADTQGKAEAGLTKAKELVESDHVSLLMGITATPVCYAVAGYVKTAHVPLAISGNCGAQTIMTDPKFQSPYLTRFSQVATGVMGPGSGWAYKQGFRKAIIVASDFGGGLESADAYALSFIKRGGTIVQEVYPPQGTTDYGSYISQLKPDADVILAFLPGTDGLRFMQQYADYAGQRKAQIVDAYGAITDGTNLAQLKDKELGVVGDSTYTTALDTPQNQAFLKAYQAAFAGKLVSKDAVQGYAGAQVLEAAIKKVNGHVEDAQALAQALATTNLETAKGPVSLDSDRDIVQNIYLYRIEKNGDQVAQHLLTTQQKVSRNWDFTPAQLSHVQFGKMKGKWTGMTTAQLDKLLSGAS